MKKEYITPHIKVVEFETNCSMMASSFLGTTDEPLEPDALKHRGSWGNLWNDN